MIAEIDSKGLVPDVNRANNVAASTSPINVALPDAPLGQTVSGTIADGQDIYYQVTVPAGDDLAINASYASLQGGELYVGYQTVPTSSTYLASSVSPTQTTQQVVIPDTQAGTYYVLLQGDTGSTGGQPFTLTTASLPLQVTGVSPAQAGNSGTTTLTIQGAEFTAGATVSLVPHGGGSSIVASAVTFQGSTTLFAQFDLAGATAGSYDVVVTDNAQKATEPVGVHGDEQRQPGPHRLQPERAVDLAPRPHRLPDAHVQQRWRVECAGAALRRLGHERECHDRAAGRRRASRARAFRFSASRTRDRPARCRRAIKGTILIPYESTTLAHGASINFRLQVMTGDNTPMDWSSLESSLQPSYMSAAAWSAGLREPDCRLRFDDRESTSLLSTTRPPI